MASRNHMSPRIERLKVELERLEGTTGDYHPGLQGELQTLIKDMRAHLSELSLLSQRESAQDIDDPSM